MKRNIYSIKDVIADEFGAIETCKNDAVATRMFKNILSQQKVNPDDFELWCLGTVDTETGVIVSDVHPVAIVDDEETSDKYPQKDLEFEK